MDNLNDFEMPDSNQELADRRLNVRFSLEARMDQQRTAEAGEEKYRDIEYVTILIPGDKLLTVHRPVQQSDKIRFRERYKAFKESKPEVLQGSPLAAWALITPSQRKELEYLNVHTIEQLSEISDSSGQAFMGFQGLKLKARQWLQAKAADAPLVKLGRQDSRDGSADSRAG
jgi:hypothetical protein